MHKLVLLTAMHITVTQGRSATTLIPIRFVQHSHTHLRLHQVCESDANDPRLERRKGHIIPEQLILFPVGHARESDEAGFVNKTHANELLREVF